MKDFLFYFGIALLWLAMDFIGKYLDEEQQKQKYACPNCHRVVDELISIFEADQERPDGSINFSLPAKAREIIKCKHCLNKNRNDL
jgi:hypothetical protein